MVLVFMFVKVNLCFICRTKYCYNIQYNKPEGMFLSIHHYFPGDTSLFVSLGK